MESQAPVPDIYSDLFSISENALGVIVQLLCSNPHTAEEDLPNSTLMAPQQNSLNPRLVGTLRFNPANWKLILMVGRKLLKAREQSIGQPYKIPSDMLQALRLTEADW